MRLLERLSLWFYGPPIEEGMWVKGVPIYLVKSIIPRQMSGQAIGNHIYISNAKYASLDEVPVVLFHHEFAHVRQWRRYGALKFIW